MSDNRLTSLNQPVSISPEAWGPPGESSDILIRRFVRFQTSFPDTINRLEEIYTQDIEFIDPLHLLHGTLALKRYLGKVSRDLPWRQMRFLDSQLNEHGAWFSWEREYLLPGAGHEVLRLRGSTRIKFTSRVYFQEECFDLGTLLGERLPVLHRLLRLKKRRLRP